ncbi:endonuclease MutS2 [Paenibacillus crassostreae]|uniref:DNA mismatch repair protein MutS n=1 Tax=Paenibacillus crassostreae TaxID=1763538 RepID=A0A167AIY3_9BACL|nr:DNA mismatch repair protein MutS [Paenibacillus crassostreae]AOZ92369.1 DNA mismatch repair protein MutS [Paenibacillus crassostreae]OAB71084.1 DNA mismatch repair protein MutS [Paenibacillus crassostreae]
MDKVTLSMLEYDRMKESIMAYAVSYAGRKRITELQPMDQMRAIQRAMEETDEARALLEKGASIPLPSLEGVDYVISLLNTGYMFTEHDFMAVYTFLNSCSQLKKYMASKGDIAPVISTYASSLDELTKVRSEIERCIEYGRVSDQASKNLERVRKKIVVIKERIQKKIATILSKHQAILQENLVSVRNGRYVIPVKKEYHKLVKGVVLDQSTSGQTVYMEPDEISDLQVEMNMLEAEEAREEGIVLHGLTLLLEADATAIKLNIEITGTYDFIIAKAKYARSIGGVAVQLNDRGLISIHGAKHPLLLQKMIPLSVEMGQGYRSLIITGPNTGGKTVALKTLGLLTLMVQSGMLVPVEPGSMFAVFSNVMTVIGDGQSIEQSLSTFSAQIQRITHMVRIADRSTLLLIDELAAGTDPGEGMALSIAILEELNRRGACMMVTTHFNELKSFASRTAGFQNARMEFDVETLEPLYRLTIGESGQSYAIEIAQKLGMASIIVDRSRDIVTKQRSSISEDWRQHMFIEDHANASDGANEANFDTTSVTIDKTNPDNPKKPPTPSVKFQVGDSVYASNLGRTGIVYRQEDAMGMVGVMIQKQRFQVNKKRLQLFLEKGELYPDDYDLDIIFDSKENRKKRKVMGRKHIEGLTIIREPGEE